MTGGGPNICIYKVGGKKYGLKPSKLFGIGATIYYVSKDVLSTVCSIL